MKKLTAVISLLAFGVASVTAIVSCAYKKNAVKDRTPAAMSKPDYSALHKKNLKDRHEANIEE